jgi:hypothetical protein
MTPTQVVAVCLRFLAIVWLLYTLNHAYSLFAYLGLQNQDPESIWFVWIQVAVQLLVCAALWFFPFTIASKLLPSHGAQSEPKIAHSMLDWQTLGVICIGLWALARAVPDVVYWATFMNISFSGDSGVSELSPDQKASLISTVVEIAVGLWLILGAKGFAALLFKIRTAGVAK